MIVTMPDGTRVKKPIRDCTGYVARSIEIEPDDVKYLLQLHMRGSEGLTALLAQLAMRFESERSPAVSHHYKCPVRNGGTECRCAELGGYV